MNGGIKYLKQIIKMLNRSHCLAHEEKNVKVSFLELQNFDVLQIVMFPRLHSKYAQFYANFDRSPQNSHRTGKLK